MYGDGGGGMGQSLVHTVKIFHLCISKKDSAKPRF
jgi:hypothetical protein